MSSPQAKKDRERVFTQLPLRTVSVAERAPVAENVRTYLRASFPSSISASPSKRIDCDVSSAVGGSTETVQENVISTPVFTGWGAAPKEPIASFAQSPPAGSATGRVTASPEPLSIRLTKASRAPVPTATSIRAFSGTVAAASPSRDDAEAPNQSATLFWLHWAGELENEVLPRSTPAASRRTSSPEAPSGPPTIVRFVRTPGTFIVWSIPLNSPMAPVPRRPAGQLVTNCWAENVPFRMPVGSTLFVRAATRRELCPFTRRAQAVPSGKPRSARTRASSTTPFAGTRTFVAAVAAVPTERIIASTASDPGLKSLRSVLQNEPSWPGESAAPETSLSVAPGTTRSLWSAIASEVTLSFTTA